MKTSSSNEWGQLKTVIVGLADNARVPPMDISLQTVNYSGPQDQDNPVPSGPYPQWILDQANQDLEVFVDFLTQQGVQVLRPTPGNCDYYNYCPRDIVLVHGEKALATPMSLASRKNNYLDIKQHFDKLDVATVDYRDELYNVECQHNPDILALREVEPMFDAANIIRANDDLLYLVSNTGNELGADLLQEYLGSGVRVHKLKGVYSYIHIDSTIAFLREGLMLLNPARIKDRSVLPEPFCRWDAIMCPEPHVIDYVKPYKHSSPWVNVNLLSINPNLVVLEEHQHNLRVELARYGIESAMLPMRQARTLGGCFHCVTLDLERADD